MASVHDLTVTPTLNCTVSQKDGPGADFADATLYRTQQLKMMHGIRIEPGTLTNVIATAVCTSKYGNFYS